MQCDFERMKNLQEAGLMNDETYKIIIHGSLEFHGEKLMEKTLYRS